MCCHNCCMCRITANAWVANANLQSLIENSNISPSAGVFHSFFTDDALFYLAENCDSAGRKAPMILFCSRTLRFWLNGNRSDYAIV